jgi:hypothetical protein
MGAPIDGLADELLVALRPRGLREHVRAAVAPGFTAAQLVERLPEEARAALVAAHPFPAEPVHTSLMELVARGAVRTRRIRYTVVLNTKGHRDMVVDVFWPA